MENLQSSKVLVELGLNEKNQWILYDEKPRKFFEYIAENLDEDNILTEKELKKYNDLVSAGLFLEGEALTEQMKTLESYFPGILSITDESVEEMERELKFLEADTQEREARILRMEETEKQLSNEIEVLEKKQIEIDYQEKQLTLECTEKAKILTELQQSNQQLIIHLNEIYTQPVSIQNLHDPGLYNFSILAKPTVSDLPNAFGSALS
jgi:chromosome segregation ATPase